MRSSAIVITCEHLISGVIIKRLQTGKSGRLEELKY